jgi:Glycosyl transferases group 1
MRLFQNIGRTRGFRNYFSNAPTFESFAEGAGWFIDTRFGAPHILAPILVGDTDAFYTNGDDEHLQGLWAREHGLRADDLEQILLAQIEHHRADVFYNLDPIRYDSSFVRKLPGCVKTSVCWRAAPSGNIDLAEYDLVVCNFPSILEDWRQKGCKVAYFFPAHDPVMDAYADLCRDNLDLIFIGGFSRYHARRIAALQAAASAPGIRARLHFEDSRLTRLANLLPFMPGLESYRHPKEIRVIRAGPLYGRDLYSALGTTKVVLNGAVDMAGDDRGNMRCFEATGCGGVLLTDSGVYPDGFVDQETMVVYSSPDQIPGLLKRLITEVSWTNAIAKAGRAMVRDRYSKDRQWAKFRELV